MNVHVPPEEHLPDVHCSGITGINIFARNSRQRLALPECRLTRPGHYQLSVMHNGTNPLIVKRKVWHTFIVRHSFLHEPISTDGPDGPVISLQSDDRVERITIAFGKLKVSKEREPQIGLWQTITVYRPGRPYFITIPRLLVELYLPDEPPNVWH